MAQQHFQDHSRKVVVQAMAMQATKMKWFAIVFLSQLICTRVSSIAVAVCPEADDRGRHVFILNYIICHNHSYDYGYIKYYV